MVHIVRPVWERGVRDNQMGRPFPPLNEHLRVSVGTADEMSRFMVAFRDIMAAKTALKTG